MLSASILLMTSIRARPRLPASLNMRRVLTSTPLTAETTMMAVSTAFEGFESGADEVGVAGRIEQVDVFALVFEVQNAGVDGEMASFFFVVVIGDAGAVVYVAFAVDGSGFEQQGVCQRRLARRPMPNQRNVADVLDFVVDHELLQSFASG